MDVSGKGHLPMLSVNGRWAASHKGEIYNSPVFAMELNPPPEGGGFFCASEGARSSSSRLVLGRLEVHVVVRFDILVSCVLGDYLVRDMSARSDKETSCREMAPQNAPLSVRKSIINRS